MKQGFCGEGLLWRICIDYRGKGKLSLQLNKLRKQGCKNNCSSQVSAFNAKVDAELHHGDESSIKWTDTSSEPPFIVGEPVSPVLDFV